MEGLEGRALLATLDIDSSVVPALLTYQATPGVTNDLTITVVTIPGVIAPARNYVFNDSGDSISLGPGAIEAGWSALDAHTVTGPSASAGSILLDTNDGPDIINIDQTDAPVAIAPTNGGDESIHIGSGSVQGINGTVLIANPTGSSGVTVDDSADPTPRAVLLNNVQQNAALQGLAPQRIVYTPSQLSGLTVNTGSGGNTLTVGLANGNPIPPGASGLVFDGGPGGDSLFLQGNGGFASDAIAASGAGAGTVQLDGSRIGFTGLRSVNDSVPVPTFTFSAPSGPQSISLLNGPIVGGAATTQIVSNENPAGFATVNFLNKSGVTINGPGMGGSTVTINAPTPGAGLSALNVVTAGGNNTVDLVKRPGAVATAIMLGAGTNFSNIFAAGLLNPGSTSVSGGAGSDTITYDANGMLASVAPQVISAGTGMTSVETSVRYDHLDHVRIVNAPDPVPTATPQTITTSFGTPFSGATVASFVDPDPNAMPGNFTASIDWGDQSTTPADQIVSNGSGGFNVLGSHSYAAPGTYPVAVTINDLGTSYVLQSPTGPVAVDTPGGATAMAGSTAVVTGPSTPFAATGLPIAATEGQPFDGGVATFTTNLPGANPASFSATIHWGDGTPDTAGTITQPGGPGAALLVGGTHTYNAPGSYPVSVVVRAPNGQAISAGSTATVAADLTVYNTRDDTNPGSLRHAFLEVDEGFGSVVTFRIPGNGPFTIAPATPLPALTRPAVIDATTQPGYRGQPLVVVSGANLPVDSDDSGITIESVQGTVKAARTRRGSRVQPLVAVDNANLESDDYDGITIQGGNTTLKGLAINGFSGVGLVLMDQGGDTIEGDYIGTDATGTRAVPNFQGVLILGTSGNQIGGAVAGEGNVISGNTAVGIQILNNQMVGDPTRVFAATGTAASNIVRGNKIGTNAAGTAALGNGQGLFINDAPDTLVGGSDPGAGNILSGNRSVAVQIFGPDATGTLLLGNAIGTDGAHALNLGNGSGVFVYAASGNTIDQSAASGGNTITFNRQFNVQVRPLSAGPTVASVVTVPATGSTISGLTLTFTMYLDRQRASNPGNYVITLLNGNLRPRSNIPVLSATYNGIYRTVDLVFGAPIPRDSNFELRVLGRAPGGLTDSSGNFLDGNQSLVRVRTGSDNVTLFRQGQTFQPGTLSAVGLPRRHASKPGRPRGQGHRPRHPH